MKVMDGFIVLLLLAWWSGLSINQPGLLQHLLLLAALALLVVRMRQSR